MKCPICDKQLSVSQHTDLIYHCKDSPNHYTVHVRQIDDHLVKAQEDFQYGNYIILKVWDIYTNQVENYFVAEEWEQPGWRWHFEWTSKEFDEAFPNFNPKDIQTINNKFEILSTFS